MDMGLCHIMLCCVTLGDRCRGPAPSSAARVSQRFAPRRRPAPVCLSFSFKITPNIYDTTVSHDLPFNERANTEGNNYKLQDHSFQYDLRKHATSVNCSTELSMGPFCVTRSNPTYQLTDPTQPNPTQYK